MKKLLYFLSPGFLTIFILSLSMSVMGQTPFVKVIKPNGGESWAVGTTHRISWNDNFTKPVKLMLSTNGGRSYTVISGASSIKGTTWDWKIPKTQTLSDNCMIKVVSTISDSYADESNHAFKIVAVPAKTKIYVIQPSVRGLEWAVGTTHKISWNDNVTGKLDIVLVKCNSAGTMTSTKYTIKSNVTGSTYNWKITSGFPVYGYYKIRVSGANGAVKGESRNVFAITKSPKGSFIKVIQPSAGSIEWASGTTHKISWNDNVSGKVEIVLVKCNSVGVVTNTKYTIKSNVIGSTYNWKITSGFPVYGYYKVRVSSANGVIGESRHAFAITKLPKGSFIKVIQPSVSGIVWATGTTHKISWNDNLSGKVNITLVKCNSVGAVTNTKYTIKSNVTGSTYDWKIKAGTTTYPTYDYYKIRISSINGSLIGESRHAFAIKSLPKGSFIKVIQPSVRGIEWANGTTHKISWNDNLPGKVDIVLVKCNSAGAVTNTKYTIKSNVTGTTYDWKIKAGSTTYPVYGYYKIRIVSTVDSHFFRDGRNAFAITKLPKGSFIKNVSPLVSGKQWKKGDTYWISWNDNLLNRKRDITLVKCNSAGVATSTTYPIKSNFVGTSYQWKITSGFPAYKYYRIRVSSVDDETLNSTSKHTFEIIAGVTIDAYPNPTTTELTVKFNNNDNQNYTMTLYNRYNMRVMLKQVNTTYMKQIRINTFDLPNGIYFLRLTSSKGVVSRKIIVQH